MFYGTLHKDLSPRSHGLVIRDLEVLPDCSGTKSMSQVGGLLDVPGEDGGGEAVVALVGSDGHLLQSFVLLDGQDGSENLLAADLHVVGNV